ncbi:hypothetical protein [Alkalicoccobacillus plakortidis]|uniref:Uncharacterized protein n=1 Tax=Alkalicoccobacillus plakortidis TaxID=444060 RepID=A0ABT0XRB2_9BACI|nr:hypothetical protein [Alkalicoccobacillus plakortidis]MCM2677804.1 hypothetical protein [Alkalicoccobacillus plakortidis]
MNPIRSEHFLWTEEKRLLSRIPFSKQTVRSTFSIDRQLKIGSNRQTMLTHKEDLTAPKTRLGIWTELGTSWFSASEWDLFPGYYQKNSLLVSHAYHRQMHLLITAFDRPNRLNNGFIRTLTIKNQSESSLSFKLLLHQQSLMPDSDDHMTFYVPEERALIHHQQHLSTLVAARFDDDIHIRYEAGSFERNWNELQGTILFSPLAAGSAESMIVIDLNLKPNQELKGTMWVVHNQSLAELEEAHNVVQNELTN